MRDAAPPSLDHPSLARRMAIEAHAVWLAARDARTPLPARVVGWLVAAYALSPIDLIPDFIPVLGILDDVVVIALGVWLLERMIPPTLLEEHRAAARAAATQPNLMAGIALILATWAVLIVTGYLLVKWFWG